MIPLLMPASILNTLPKNENASMIIAMAYVVDVNTSIRAMERNSLALLFQHIKGCSEAGMYTGCMRGNVIKIRPRLRNNTSLWVTERRLAILKRVVCNGSSTDDPLLAAIGVGIQTADVPPNTIFSNFTMQDVALASIKGNKMGEKESEEKKVERIKSLKAAIEWPLENDMDKVSKVMKKISMALASMVGDDLRGLINGLNPVFREMDNRREGLDKRTKIELTMLLNHMKGFIRSAEKTERARQAEKLEMPPLEGDEDVEEDDDDDIDGTEGTEG